MKIRFLTALATVLTALCFGFSVDFRTAEARCATPAFQTSYRQAKAVFVGEVVGDEKNGDVRKISFKIEKYWKGANSKTVEIRVYETMRFQSWFKKGEKYLIYASGGADGKLNVARCSRSREIKFADEDLQKLGKGKIPR